MATGLVSRAIKRSSQSPSRFLPFLHTQNLSEPSQLVFSPFLEEQLQPLSAPLGFPPHRDAGRDHGSLFLSTKFSSQTPLSVLPYAQVQTQYQKVKLDPPFFAQHWQNSGAEACWKLTNSNYFPPFFEIEEVILPSLNEDTTSPMLMSTKRTFNPSTIVRKRRHGFLARKRTVGGRRILARRFLKGRRKLSA